jgi:hypothetical protein
VYWGCPVSKQKGFKKKGIRGYADKQDKSN